MFDLTRELSKGSMGGEVVLDDLIGHDYGRLFMLD